MLKKQHLFVCYDVMLKYICAKNIYITNVVLKYANIFKKLLKWFGIYVIPYDWIKSGSHVKSLIIIITQVGAFKGDDHKYVVN
jgi:hypothetical protein